MPDAQPKPSAADVDPPTVGHLRDLWVDWHLDPLPRSQGVALVPAYQAEFDRWLAEHDAQVLRDAADAYQVGGWADDMPAGSSRPALILGMAQRATDWLRARADRIAPA